LADPNDNQSIGWITSFYASMQDEAPAFMMEGDIQTRIGNQGIIVLDPLVPVEVKKFLTDLINCFVDKKCASETIAKDKITTTVDLYPFTKDGLDQFIHHASTDQHNALPRTILKAVTACALESLRSNKPVFDSELVDQVVPQEFAENP
jgi:hypothetical protein